MTETKEIIKIGNSKGIIIPAEFLEILKLDKGDQVIIRIDMDYDSGQVLKIITKNKKGVTFEYNNSQR